jgi:hypothetical protein
MVDFIIGDMLASNIQIGTTGGVIAANVSVTTDSLPTYGLYLSGGGNLAVATNSSQVMRIDNNGNVYVQGSGQIFQSNIAMPTLNTVLTYQLAL